MLSSVGNCSHFENHFNYGHQAIKEPERPILNWMFPTYDGRLHDNLMACGQASS